MSTSTGMIYIRLVSVGLILLAASILTKHLQALTPTGVWPVQRPSAQRTITAFGTKALPRVPTPKIVMVKKAGARASDWSTVASTGKVTIYST